MSPVTSGGGAGWGRRLRDALGVLVLGALLLLALEALARRVAPDPEPPVPIAPKPPGLFRIVALGGSTTLGVPDGRQGFVAQLERALRRAAPGRPLDVVNLARSGAGSRSVRAVLPQALEARPDLIVLLSGHNEYLEPLPGPLQRLRDRSRLAAALGAWLEGERAEDPALPARLPAVDPAGREAALRSEAWLANLDAVVGAVREAGVPLFLCTAPSNLADWPPAWRRVDGAVDPEIVDSIRASAPADALAAARAALEGRPDDAMLTWLEARALRDLGRPGEARDRFLRARARDPVPRRAFDAFNQALRARGDRDGVRLVDVAARFEEQARDGLVGFDLVCDNCHPTPLGNALIARELALAMAEEGLFLSRRAAVPDLATFAARNAAALGDAAARRRARLRWLLSNAIYSMKAPFLNFEASRAYLLQALRVAPGEWRVHANLATLALLAGDRDEGRARLEQAARLKGSPLDPQDRDVTPYLEEALASLRAAGTP
ncbi:MAG: SGNH/GDSL hydrolase family protein [Myxococcota bacterium]